MKAADKGQLLNHWKLLKILLFFQLYRKQVNLDVNDPADWRLCWGFAEVKNIL